MKPTKDIYFAGGCFWGTEHYFKQIEGVTITEVGFANVHSVYKGDSHGREKEMLCKCCANLGIKKVKVLKISTLTLAVVGITGLEPATSRPPEATQLTLNPVENQRF